MKSDRIELYKSVPLESPLMVQIFPCYACNFKCIYCLYALPREEHGFISEKLLMDFDLYKKTIDDIASAKFELKMLRFAGIGEPLLHPRIADMVSYAVKKKIANSIDIVTNASLLTKELSCELIKAGLSTLRVSLQGLSSKEYKENCLVDVDFDVIKENLTYYYKNCGESRTYIKIIDYMLKESPEREKLFYDTFSPISHITAIEHLIPAVDGINFMEIADGTELLLTQDGNKMNRINVCPQPFYMMQINPDGNITACCSVNYPGLFGHVDTGVAAVWNNKPLTEFRKKSLQSGSASASEACSKCVLHHYSVNKEDMLDGHEKNILMRMAIGNH
jgi:radical SAM protein with 4Fe4S-binding SPASM domain